MRTTETGKNALMRQLYNRLLEEKWTEMTVAQKQRDFQLLDKLFQEHFDLTMKYNQVATD